MKNERCPKAKTTQNFSINFGWMDEVRWNHTIWLNNNYKIHCSYYGTLMSVLVHAKLFIRWVSWCVRTMLIRLFCSLDQIQRLGQYRYLFSQWKIEKCELLGFTVLLFSWNRSDFDILDSRSLSYETLLCSRKFQKHKFPSLSDCNWTRTHNHLVRKRTGNKMNRPVSLNGLVFVYELSGCGFESRCSFNFSSVPSLRKVVMKNY